mmetsp:Transcript_30089/g.94831  ORF Transcript_30089/g.94831 Transcript_30089/m.94831 type:complete len:244 (+) Transcript_30089:524-1255(+)
MVAIPSLALMHCIITVLTLGAGVLWWSMAETQMRMIQDHTIMGLCHSSSTFWRACHSTSVRKSGSTSRFMLGSSLAAWTSNSTAAKPYLATWFRNVVHFLSCNSHAMIMQTFAKASKTLPRALIRRSHHLFRVSDTYKARQKGTQALIWLARSSSGSVSISASLSNCPMKIKHISPQNMQPMLSITATFNRAVLSIVKTVPVEKTVMMAEYFTSAFMSYRMIFSLSSLPSTTVVTEFVFDFTA